MIQPVTYPSSYVNELNNVDGAGSFYIRKNKSRQPAPFTEPAPYYLARVKTHQSKLIGIADHGGMANASTSKSNYVIGPTSPWYQSPYQEIWTDARNNAYKELVGALRRDAMLAVNYIQRQQAISALVTRLQQLRRTFVALRQGNVAGVVLSLNIKGNVPDDLAKRVRSLKARRRRETRSFRRSAADVGDVFLEFHFGWIPLFHDIYNCIDILQQPLPTVSVRARGRKVPITLDWKYNISSVEYIRTEAVGFAGCGVSAEVFVDNPNLWLANQLGLINPAAVVWELVPFSFVVDWFTSIGSFIDSWTDFLGLKFTRQCCTTVMKVPTCRYTYSYYAGNPLYEKLAQCTLDGVWVWRSLDLPSLTLGVLPAKRLSLTRAATSLALLFQQLRRAGKG